MSTLTVVIITKNEEDMIEAALKSASFADEIIVIDAKSSDGTVALAKKYATKIYSKTWSGFASQRNYSISKVRSDWIFVLDADERISPELRKELKKLLALPKIEHVAYDVGRRNFFYGKEMRHGGWNTERMIRLFKKGKATYAQQQIHEYVEIEGTQGSLYGDLYHFTHRDIASNLLKTRQYAIVQSQIEVDRNYPQVTKWSLFRNILDHFWLRFITLEAYKDGMEGFIESTYQAFSQIFVIQSMIWERQRKKSVQKIYKELDKKALKGEL